MKVIKVSQNDRNIPISIILAYDCVNELILAEVYNSNGILAGNVNAILPNEFDSLPEGIALGAIAGTTLEVRCNFSSIEAGKEYTLVFRTQNTGVLSKSPLLVANKSGIYLPDNCNTDVTKGFVTNGAGDKFLSNDGTYKHVTGSETKAFSYIWAEGDDYDFFISDFGSIHEFKINGISYPEILGFYTVLLKNIIIDTDEVELMDGDVITIDYYPINEEPAPDDEIFNDNYDDTYL
jgi:hypothetical protein